MADGVRFSSYVTASLLLSLLILLPPACARPIADANAHTFLFRFPRFQFLRLLPQPQHHRNPLETFSSDPEFFNEPLPVDDAYDEYSDTHLSSVDPEYDEEASHLIEDPEFFNDQPLRTSLRSGGQRTGGWLTGE